jgi:hypothetical protein
VAITISAIATAVPCELLPRDDGMNSATQPNHGATTPVLSLILCSRNDQYMGNSRWRLETTLNYLGRRVRELGREKDVEVLVADWGSQVALREVLDLNPAAAALTSFLHIPPPVAQVLQNDSPFAEVLALNAAARRARGEYVGRIDQDTLVGKRFLATFFDCYEGKRQLGPPLHSALLFSNLRTVPYRFAVRCPALPIVERFVSMFGGHLWMEASGTERFFVKGVGIWLVRRSLWVECGGYDERLIYMGKMEENMIKRLMQKYELVNLGKLVDYDFYHLEHYHPLAVRKSSTHRRHNREVLRGIEGDSFHPNHPDWGLGSYPLPVEGPRNGVSTAVPSSAGAGYASFLGLLWRVGVQMGWDRLRLAFRAAVRVVRTGPVGRGIAGYSRKL